MVILFVVCGIQIAFAALLLTNNLQSRLDEIVKSQWEDPANNEKVYGFETEFDCCEWPDVFNVTGRLPCPVVRADNSTIDNCRDAALDWLSQRYYPIGVVVLVLGALQVSDLGFGIWDLGFRI